MLTGDAFCAAFHTAHSGLQAALAAQRALRNAPWSETGPLPVRMALHAGSAELQKGEFTSGEYVTGMTLSHTSRLLEMCRGGYDQAAWEQGYQMTIDQAIDYAVQGEK